MNKRRKKTNITNTKDSLGNGALLQPLQPIKVTIIQQTSIETNTMIPPIINPYARPVIFPIDTAMGPQSQRRVSLVQRTHQLASSNSGYKKKRKGGQQTIFGGKAFDPMSDCKRCRGVAAGRDPHHAHDERCPRNKRTKGLTPKSSEQLQVEKDLLAHFAKPLTQDEKGSAKYLTKENVNRFFDPSTHKKASPKAMTSLSP